MNWTFGALSYTTSSRSRLMELPPEIRDLIYEFALTSEKPLVAFCLDAYQRDTYHEAIQPSLTRVNRQTRKESLPIFYQCNDIILHTDIYRTNDIRCWLACVELHLAKLHCLSIWTRYVTLTNEPGASNGAICISIVRSKDTQAWQVVDDWKWITVTRKPLVAANDAKLLQGALKKILAENANCLESAEIIVGILTDLKMIYVKDKMS